MSTARTDVVGGRGSPPPGRRGRELAPIALVDLLDRLLGSGVVVAGDVVVSLAGVDLVEVRLQLVISAVRAEMARSREGALS
ncbi:gas vesicle protein GvpJ [Terrabacter sp. NPDC080008]|uniref:gas vesicle protein GvpJ n=1 Tax=Terrabacter sp. NPDC080008 TaxID=3155176 RepID=UPI00344D848B